MYTNILVPMSFDDDRDVSGALEIAQVLAKKGAHITVIHVMEQIPSYAISYMPSQYLDGSRTAIKAELATLLSGIDNAHGVVISGHSGRSILDYAGENAIDCIVIASHRPGMQDYFLGGTAAQVVRHAQCAVHVVR